jgi:hypothetical protein
MSILGIYASSASKLPIVANPFAWYDASDTSTISLSGSKVTQWNDKSANGYHLVQGTNARRPESGTQTINGLNVLQCDYISSLTSNAAASNYTFLNYSANTIFIVFKTDSLPSTDPYWLLTTRGGSAGEGAGISIRLQHYTDKLKDQVLDNLGGSQVVDADSTSTVSNATTTLWTLIRDPDNGTAANRSDMRKNAGAAEKNNTLTVAASNAAPAQTLRVSDYTGGGTFGLVGKLAEIIIYNSSLSAGDITTNQNYLISKWGI